MVTGAEGSLWHRQPVSFWGPKAPPLDTAHYWPLEILGPGGVREPPKIWGLKDGFVCILCPNLHERRLILTRGGQGCGEASSVCLEARDAICCL